MTAVSSNAEDALPASGRGGAAQPVVDGQPQPGVRDWHHSDSSRATEDALHVQPMQPLEQAGRSLCGIGRGAELELACRSWKWETECQQRLVLGDRCGFQPNWQCRCIVRSQEPG